MSPNSDKPEANTDLRNRLMHVPVRGRYGTDDRGWQWLQSSLEELMERCWKRGDANLLPFSFRSETECDEYAFLMDTGLIDALRLPGVGNTKPNIHPKPFKWEHTVIRRRDGAYDMEVRIVERTPVRV